MRSITPFLWYDDNLEDALDFYASVFADVRVHWIERQPDGRAFLAEFELGGQRYRAINGGPHFQFNEAFSLAIDCEGQDEVDRYWTALTADGGAEGQCGWCKDKFGLWWQVVPVELGELMSSGTGQQSARVHEAMLKMVKLDVAGLRAAFNG